MNDLSALQYETHEPILLPDQHERGFLAFGPEDVWACHHVLKFHGEHLPDVGSITEPDAVDTGKKLHHVSIEQVSNVKAVVSDEIHVITL